jgi:hypothetical protein
LHIWSHPMVANGLLKPITADTLSSFFECFSVYRYKRCKYSWHIWELRVGGRYLFSQKDLQIVIWVRLFFFDLVKLVSENLLNGDVNNGSLALAFHWHGLVFVSTVSESCLMDAASSWYITCWPCLLTWFCKGLEKQVSKSECFRIWLFHGFDWPCESRDVV